MSNAWAQVLKWPRAAVLTVAGLFFFGALLLSSRGCQTRQAMPSSAAMSPSRSVLPSISQTNAASLAELGQQKAVVFSPDIAGSGNRLFYQRLGFQYFESANWKVILADIIAYNHAHPAAPIQEVFLETHGCNGNGLKLQRSPVRNAPRSYISLGGLQERLADSGVEWIILTACNAGRLFRPEIYRALNLRIKDHTVLPATLGVVNASANFDPARHSIKFVRRSASRVEQTSEGFFRELSPAVRERLGLPDSAEPFVVSNLFMQMLLGDERLHLTDADYVCALSDETENEETNEAIFQSFLRLLHDLAGREVKGR